MARRGRSGDPLPLEDYEYGRKVMKAARGPFLLQGVRTSFTVVPNTLVPPVTPSDTHPPQSRMSHSHA
jgi:hypothetical protein